MTGELRNKIDSLWDIFFSGGIVNPIDAVEQMTYLMFIKDLDDTDNLRAKEAAMLGISYKSIFADEIEIGDRKIDGNQLKWSTFHDFPAQRIFCYSGMGFSFCEKSTWRQKLSLQQIHG